jgi:hypothetical protein
MPFVPLVVADDAALHNDTLLEKATPAVGELSQGKSGARLGLGRMDSLFKVIAIISAFNEGDIISPVIRHLTENGIDVYLLDNHSTDDTVSQAAQWLGKGLMHIEIFPQSSEEADKFQWAAILRRKEELAGTLQANWFIHHDADEIRESPWPGLNLKQAIQWVDTFGYNCIDFQVLNFVPVDDGFRSGADPKTYFKFYEDALEVDRVQRKAWKTTSAPVSLVTSAGHEAQFQDRRVFPIQFLLRHYPIRGQTHGTKKVFRERKVRFLTTERSQGWHVQYDPILDESHSFLKDPSSLVPFDLDRVQLELMLPGALIRNFTKMQRERDELRQHATNLEADRADVRKHAANLEIERADLRQRIANMELELRQSSRQMRILEAELNRISAQATSLEQLRQQLEERNAGLDRELATVHDSFVWRSTSVLRKLFACDKAGSAEPLQRSLPEPRPIYSSLDVPGESQTTASETCLIRGWTCSSNGIASVKVLID